MIELGPGTGVVTKALLERGVRPQRLIAIEYNPDLLPAAPRALSPASRCLRATPTDLAATLPKRSRRPRLGDRLEPAARLPPPPADRARLIEAALERMALGRPYIQFSYMPHPPAEPVPGRFSAEASHWIWLNLPPARVWLYPDAPPADANYAPGGR